MMKRHISKIFILFLCVFLSSCVTFSDSTFYYRQAQYHVKKGDSDMVFMKLKALLNEDWYSPYSPSAAFGVAEYYFEANAYIDSAEAFRKYLKRFPLDQGAIFAELVVFKMVSEIEPGRYASLTGQYLLDRIRDRIFSKPNFLFFGERKRYLYRSALGNLYIAFNYEDRVKVIRNGKLFIELLP